MKSTTPEGSPIPPAERWIVMLVDTNLECTRNRRETQPTNREYIMSTIINRKAVTAALGATVAAATVPALLVLGAGTAQAGTSAWTTTDALGVTVRARGSCLPHGFQV